MKIWNCESGPWHFFSPSSSCIALRWHYWRSVWFPWLHHEEGDPEILLRVIYCNLWSSLHNLSSHSFVLKDSQVGRCVEVTSVLRRGCKDCHWGVSHHWSAGGGFLSVMAYILCLFRYISFCMTTLKPRRVSWMAPCLTLVYMCHCVCVCVCSVLDCLKSCILSRGVCRFVWFCTLTLQVSCHLQSGRRCIGKREKQK